ncbi:MAG: hypothetical protein M3340_15605 [Actinomycetota bacterium]|nr:hypothetical protein [Actinomycetota bacterium]
MKRLALVTALALVVLAASASSAAASTVTVSSIVCADSSYKPAWVAAGSAGDKNGNGAVCVKGKRAVDELWILTVTVSIESGGCESPADHLTAASFNGTVDTNQNGLVCYDPAGKGRWADDLSIPTSITFG